MTSLAFMRKNHQDNPFGTHQEVLTSLVNKTSGPIIEFGSGHCSTDLLHKMCKKTKRTLITIDNNEEWLKKFQDKYLGKGYEKDHSGWHKMFYVPGDKESTNPADWINFLDNSKHSNYINSLEYSICFVDQWPWLARVETIKRMKQKSQYTIVHDCDFFPENGLFGKIIHHTDCLIQKDGQFDFSDTFKHYKVYHPKRPWPGLTGPPTLVGSDFLNELPDLTLCKNSQLKTTE